MDIFLIKPVGGAKTHAVMPRHSRTLVSACGRIFDEQGPEPEGTPLGCKKCRASKIPEVQRRAFTRYA